MHYKNKFGTIPVMSEKSFLEVKHLEDKSSIDEIV